MEMLQVSLLLFRLLDLLLGFFDFFNDVILFGLRDGFFFFFFDRL